MAAALLQVYGPTAVNVYQLMETLRQEGDLFTIGAETALLESRDRRRVGRRGRGWRGHARSGGPARGRHLWHGPACPPCPSVQEGGRVSRADGVQEDASSAGRDPPAGWWDLSCVTLPQRANALHRRLWVWVRL